jgi:putative membrane protein
MKNVSRTEKILFACLVFWSGAGLIFTLFKIDAAHPRLAALAPGLKEFVMACFGWGDFFLMLLAAANLYAYTFGAWGKRDAITWAVVICVVGAGVEILGTLTGFPFGSYTYSAKFGPVIGGVLPLAIPLAWFCVVTASLVIVLRVIPHCGVIRVAALTATATTFLDWIMEPFATLIKGYWIWQNGIIPLQNYISWWAVTFLLVLTRPLYAKLNAAPADIRPVFVLVSFLVLFAAARLVHGV